jgi:DNA-binding NarL/FixJ family response regulator
VKIHSSAAEPAKRRLRQMDCANPRRRTESACVDTLRSWNGGRTSRADHRSSRKRVTPGGLTLISMNKRILCIEDDSETAALIAEDLGERGYLVTVAADGHSGLSAILKTSPDIVLCDINMPGMTGFEVMECLSALAPKFEALPFIFLTARTDRDSELKGRRLGADDYVTKPVDFEILAAIIEARLGRGARNEVWSRQVALNDRELECLTWSARGKTSPEIAAILGLSKRTVNFHIENACRKLNVSTRTEAVARAASGRLIDP